MLKQREDDKERRRKEALRRVAPGWEGGGGLVPDKVGVTTGGGANEHRTPDSDGGHTRQKSVMEDLVDQLAALDAASSSNPTGLSL